MQEEKAGKITALIISALMILPMLSGFSPDSVALCAGSPAYTRLTFHFFHVSVFHWALNVWCYLSIVFYYNVSAGRQLLSLLAASAVPVLWNVPTVGFSAVCFSLMAYCSLVSSNKARHISASVLIASVGLFLPRINGAIHLLAYALGLVVSLLTVPICERK